MLQYYIHIYIVHEQYQKHLQEFLYKNFFFFYHPQVLYTIHRVILNRPTFLYNVAVPKGVDIYL